MNDIFNDQKEKLVSLSHEISLLRQQVNYLLRNEKPLELLDLDVLMNRTHTIYDTLCAINLGNNAEEEDVELDPEAIAGLFGMEMQEEEQPELEEEEQVENQDNEMIPEPVEVIPEATEAEVFDEAPKAEEVSVEEHPAEPVAEETPANNGFGSFFRLEDTPAEEPAVEEKIEDAVFTMPEPEEDELPLGVETLGESMIQEDHSLAAKLQQNPVRDLRSVIGINDKFLFVNELFGGSMEKYNNSIDNLNDLKTLNGALIYLNELKIELQWNSSNEAYQKLADLVRRKFE